MKKLTALLLAVFMGITGCSSPGKGSDNETPGPSASEASVNEENQEPKGEYQIISPEETPAGLEEFLSNFVGVADHREDPTHPELDDEYDCSDGRETWIMPGLGYITGFFEGYPVHPDFKDYYYYLDEKEGDWILSNIFNFSPEAIREVKEEHPVHGPGYTEPVYVDGQYKVAGPMGAGDNDNAKIIGTAYNGKSYLVNYDYCWANLGTGELTPYYDLEYRHYAILEYKQIDGKGWWSIYKDTVYPEEIEGCKELFPEEENQEDHTDTEEVKDVTAWDYLAEQYYEIYLSYLDFTNAGGKIDELVNVTPEQKNRFAENYGKYNAGHVFTNHVFDFDTTASRITNLGNGSYEADCYVFVMNSALETATNTVTPNTVTIHAKLRYTPEEGTWILTSQKGESYAYEGHTMIHCAN